MKKKKKTTKKKDRKKRDKREEDEESKGGKSYDRRRAPHLFNFLSISSREVYATHANLLHREYRPCSN